MTETPQNAARPDGAGGHRFEAGLDRTPANYVPLTPASLLARAAAADRALARGVTVVDGALVSAEVGRAHDLSAAALSTALHGVDDPPPVHL